MKLPATLQSRIWWLLPLAALGFLIWVQWGAVQRSVYVTGIGRESRLAPGGNPAHTLIVTEHISQSYGWIGQTRQMLAEGGWRVRSIDYENVPHGREVHAASPYRWWLVTVAWGQHILTGRSLVDAVESAALYADPLLQGLFLLAASAFVAWRFGAFAAGLTAVACVWLYPFAAGFQVGCPDDFALLLVLAPSSLLIFLAGLSAGPRPATALPGTSPGHPVRGWFVASGVIGGLGLWISVPVQVPLLIGTALGGLLVAWSQRGAVRNGATGLGPPIPWRAWSLGGALTVGVAYLLEYFPGHLGDWELRALHPLYGLAWLGAGELLTRTTAVLRRENLAWRVPDGAVVVLAIAAVAAVPVLMWQLGNQGFLAVDVLAYRLTRQPEAVMAPNLAVWISGKGITAPFVVTVLPLLASGVAAWLALRRQTEANHRAVLAFTLGPVLALLLPAYLYLRWWQLLGAVLLPLLVAVAWTTTRSAARWAWGGLVLLLVGPGISQLNLPTGPANTNVLSVPEVEGLVERDLAQWLGQHNLAEGGPVVLAPPSLTTALHFYGGIRGLGSLAWENKLGLAVTIRVAISTTSEEARALMRQRGVTHIILPTWDDFFDPYVQAASVQTSDLFFTKLDRWVLPSWLRPVPYRLPGIAGFEDQSVRIFEVVDDQEAPVAASRLTEYFIAMGQLENARIAAQKLRSFPADFGVLVTRAQLDAALVDSEAFTASFTTLLQRLAGGADRALLWDRRVNLAVVLARGKRLDLARPQVERCFAEVSARRLRSLPTSTLFHLLVLAKALNLEIRDPALRELAQSLLSSEMRTHLAGKSSG